MSYCLNCGLINTANRTTCQTCFYTITRKITVQKDNKTTTRKKSTESTTDCISHQIVQAHFQQTVRNAVYTVCGFLHRSQSSQNDIPSLPKCAVQMCGAFYGFHFMHPLKDTCNHIPTHHVPIANKFKAEANYLMSKKQYKEALELYTTALSYNISDAKIFCNRSLCNMKLHKYKNALSDAKYAIKCDPLWYKTWLRMAQSFECIKWFPEAHDMIKQAISCELNEWNNSHVLMLMKYRDVLQTKYKPPILFENEHEVTNIELFLMSPKRIQYYYSNILPPALRKNGNNSDIGKEWYAKQWVRKVHLFTELNYCKLMIECLHNTDRVSGVTEYVYIENRAPVLDPTEEWCIKFEGTNELYLGKRMFSLSISHAKYHHFIFLDWFFCIPSSGFVIQCILKAMMSPVDIAWQLSTKKCRPAGRKPYSIRFHQCLKDVFGSVKKQIEKYDVICFLDDSVNANGSIAFADKYLYEEPDYLFNMDIDSMNIMLNQN